MSAATYLYCLVHATKPPSLRAAPAGLPGTGKPRALEAGDGLWLVAADAPRDRYGEKPIEKGLQDLTWVSSCAVPHEAMVEYASKAGTVLPMKLFALRSACDEARAASHGSPGAAFLLRKEEGAGRRARAAADGARPRRQALR